MLETAQLRFAAAAAAGPNLAVAVSDAVRDDEHRLAVAPAT
jgi:hypothetical protein